MENEVPIHKSLLQPNLIFGVPNTIFYVLVMGAFYIGLAFDLKYSLIVVPFFVAVRLICKNDPDYLDILVDNLTEPDLLEG